MARPRPPSRTQRWADAVNAAKDALSDLKAVQDEYQDWRDNLPENLEGSAVAEKLDEVLGIDIDGAIDVVDEAESVDLPLGFGRD